MAHPKKIWGLKEYLTMYEGDSALLLIYADVSCLEWFYFLYFIGVRKLLTVSKINGPVGG